MINLHKFLQKPTTFQRLTGVSTDKFTELLETLTPLWAEAEKKRLSRPNRKRAIGAGNKRKLTLPHALFLLLLYYRTYVNHVFIGMLLRN